MATPLPVVCSLEASALRDRAAELASIGAEALVRSVVDGTRARLRFRPTVADRLAAVVAAERDCCAWLGLDLTRRDDDLELVLTAPPGAEAAMHQFVSAFGRPATGGGS
jgi:hypothetical protein